MDTPGPSNSSSESSNHQLSQNQPSTVSPFGFPEKDVITFINNCGMSPDEARDFMLFLTYTNQISLATNGGLIDLACASALMNLIKQHSTGDIQLQKFYGPTASTISEANSTLDVSSVQSENVPSTKFMRSERDIPKTARCKDVKGFKPVFAKHNDAKFYPNIMCVICKEWVCSRSRRIHIGAHFEYKKYSCSSCEFSHTKDIFVETHIRKCHNRVGSVVQKDDPLIEGRIEDMCNESIAMTRDFLSGRYDEKNYRNYANMCTGRSQIANKERRSRTQVLTTVTDAANRAVIS